MTNIRTARPAPLRAPDVSRMEELERQLGADMARTAELWATVEAARGPWLEAEERLDRYDLEPNPDPALWRQLRAEVERTRTASRAAQDAWREAEAPEHARRVEWLQLQIVRGFLPRCALCERTVAPVYFELGRERPPALCLDCFDTWFMEHDPDSGRKPPSHWLQVIAQEARDLESERRQQPQPEQMPLHVLGADEVAPEPPPARPCWHCGGPVGDLGDLEDLYTSRAGLVPRVVLKVVALVPEGTQPEIGEVCLLCLDHDLELHERWAEIETKLSDPGQRRNERALHQWVHEAPDSPLRQRGAR
jgi:hypothetical protein